MQPRILLNAAFFNRCEMSIVSKRNYGTLTRTINFGWKTIHSFYNWYRLTVRIHILRGQSNPYRFIKFFNTFFCWSAFKSRWHKHLNWSFRANSETLMAWLPLAQELKNTSFALFGQIIFWTFSMPSFKASSMHQGLHHPLRK